MSFLVLFLLLFIRIFILIVYLIIIINYFLVWPGGVLSGLELGWFGFWLVSPWVCVLGLALALPLSFAWALSLGLDLGLMNVAQDIVRLD